MPCDRSDCTLTAGSSGCGVAARSARGGVRVVRQPHHTERRQGDARGMRQVVPRRVLRCDLPEQDVRAGVLGGVGVEDLRPPAALGKADPVVVPDHRSQVDDAGDRPTCARRREAQEGQHAVVGVVGIDPAKAGPVEVLLPQGRFGAVDRVQLAHQLLGADVLGVLQQVPVDAARASPLRGLGDLAAHEQQLPPGMRPHPRQ